VSAISHAPQVSVSHAADAIEYWDAACPATALRLEFDAIEPLDLDEDPGFTIFNRCSQYIAWLESRIGVLDVRSL
jgi:hypothetical protein